MTIEQYYINEAILTLPGGIAHDNTLNIIKLSQPDAALIISRGQMSEDDKLDSAIDQQLEKLRQQVKALEYTPRQSTQLGSDAQVEAIELQNQFLRGNEKVYQLQVAFVVPGTRTMMAVTYARTTRLNQEDAAYWSSLKESIRFRSQAE